MFIREAELFQRIPSHIIDELASFVVEESYPAEHVLFREGEDADYLYILEDGQIAITIQGKDVASFPVSDPGSAFGWSALVEPRRYTATAESTMESKVLKLDADRMLSVFERHPHEGLIIMRRLAGVVAGRLIKSYQELKQAKG